MPDLKDFTKALDQGDQKKLFIPGVGHRVVNLSNGRIHDLSGMDFTDKLKPPEKAKQPVQTVVDDGHRTGVAKLAESGIFKTNSVLLHGRETLAAFEKLKTFLLDDLETDTETIEMLTAIGTFLTDTISRYTEKKEMSRGLRDLK